jgi:AcrR family transcriptional regulator
MVRARFTRDEVASAALRIVDEAGLTALSMRSLAAALGTGPMTMYNYVAGKEGLEELVVASIVAEVSVPPSSGDWQRDVHAIATEMWRAVRAHPAAIPLVLTRRMSSAAGFAVVDRLSAFHAVFAMVVGAAQAKLAGPLTGDAAEAAAQIGAAAGSEFAHIEQLSKVAMETSVEDDFDVGLRMLLDGIAARSR